MSKLLFILLLGLILEAVGVVFLCKGLKQIGDVPKVTVSEVVRVVKQGATNQNVLLGVLFEAVFFGCLLYLLSQAAVSLVWPLTALGFVITTFAARFILREEVSALRWFGVVLIVIGAGLITWSENKPKTDGPSAPVPASIAGEAK